MSDWTADVVARMHTAGVTGLELAKEAGITNSYLSNVLHDKKGNEQTQQKIFQALERLENKTANNETDCNVEDDHDG